MFFVLILSFVLLAVYNFWWKRRSYPPGPTPLPIVGNTHQFKKRPYDCWLDWRKQFGSVYTFWHTEIPVVVFADYETIYETLVKDAETYSGRQSFGKQSDILHGGRFGVVDTDGELWRSQRRFILSTFRDFGMGKNLMQTKIHQQIEELISDCSEEQKQKGVVDLPAHIERCVGSDDFDRYRKQMHELTGNFFTPTMLVISHVNFAHRLPYFNTYYEKIVKTSEEFRRYFDSELQEHERKLESGEVNEKSADDFVYVYMNEMRKSQPGSYFHDKMLRALVLDLFITGQETTSATLVFLVIYVLNHPHVQAEIHRELDEKIGSDRLIGTADRNELVYLNAVINEIFPEPEKFKPERFVDSEGKLKKIDELIPFSVGKRECIGRSLATMELLLITANLFNRFRLEFSDLKHPPSMEKIVEFGARYHPFKISSIGPLIFMILDRYFKIPIRHGLVIQVALIVSALMYIPLIFAWNSTIFLFGTQHSIVLISSIFVMGMIAIGSDIIFMPFMMSFDSVYLSAYFIGIGVSSLLPSLLSIAQGTVLRSAFESLCLGTSSYRCHLNVTTGVMEPQFASPRFSVNVFYTIIFVWVCGAGLSFYLINNHMDMLKHLSFRGSRKQNNVDGLLDRNNEEGRRVSLELQNVHPPTVEFEKKQTSRWGDLMILLSIAFVGADMNTILTSVQTFASIPYSQIGSFIGSLIVFPAVNIFGFFRSAPQC
ncbi:hypothetical protein M3Y94_01263700 [Aphelenchoides besseyi]|nr:hypothetical protein M3Y94_01263700 [Aphelenchoides besseyi]